MVSIYTRASVVYISTFRILLYSSLYRYLFIQEHNICTSTFFLVHCCTSKNSVSAARAPLFSIELPQPTYDPSKVDIAA
jgi:hypothetical protein